MNNENENLPVGDGIIPQIVGANIEPSIPAGEMPTLDDFKDMMTVLSGKTLQSQLADKIDFGVAPVTPDDGIKLKIKDGYLYQIGTVITGADGARRYVDICRAKGFSDQMIGDDIFITETEGIISGQIWTCLNKIEWHKNREGKI
jgi:hypothetical protein